MKRICGQQCDQTPKATHENRRKSRRRSSNFCHVWAALSTSQHHLMRQLSTSTHLDYWIQMNRNGANTPTPTMYKRKFFETQSISNKRSRILEIWDLIANTSTSNWFHFVYSYKIWFTFIPIWNRLICWTNYVTPCWSVKHIFLNLYVYEMRDGKDGKIWAPGKRSGCTDRYTPNRSKTPQIRGGTTWS
jgi:hypothetical protein